MHFGIISAGDGSRLASEGFSFPKPLVPIHGVPMIERLVRIFMDCDAEKIAVIVNGDNPETVKHLHRLAEELPMELVIRKTPSPMHSLNALSPYFDGERFCVTTVDTVFQESSFRSMMREFSESSYDGLMGVTALIDDEKPLYVDVDSEMMIKGFHDFQDGCRFVSAGIYALKSKALDVLKGCLESGQTRMRFFQRRLLETGMQLKAFDMGQVVDVDHVSDIAKAEQIASLK